MEFNSTPSTLLLTVKPTKGNAFFILKSLGNALWIFIVIGVFLGGATIPVLLQFIGIEISIGALVFSAVILFLIFWGISFLFTRMQMNATEYRFYNNKIEFSDGFLVKSKKNIPYSRVTNTEQGQSIMERIFGLGHLSIDTAGTGGHELTMRYIDDSDDLYEKMNQIINAGSKE